MAKAPRVQHFQTYSRDSSSPALCREQTQEANSQVGTVSRRGSDSEAVALAWEHEDLAVTQNTLLPTQGVSKKLLGRFLGSGGSMGSGVWALEADTPGW